MNNSNFLKSIDMYRVVGFGIWGKVFFQKKSWYREEHGSIDAVTN